MKKTLKVIGIAALALVMGAAVTTAWLDVTLCNPRPHGIF